MEQGWHYSCLGLRAVVPHPQAPPDSLQEGFDGREGMYQQTRTA